MRFWAKRSWAAIIGASVGCLVAACTTGDHPQAVRVDAVPSVTEVASVERTASQVQVIAHPDDDLYFMAPDVQRFIAVGARSTTIVVTAGENNGSGSLDREHYAGQRQEGLRAAYAHMAGVANEWNRAAVTVDGKWIERDTLRANPQVTVVFLNLPDGKDTVASRTRALENLWVGTYPAVSSVIPTGSVVADAQSYTAQELTTVLIGLFGQAEVTVARTLDSHPDHRFPADHTDHVHAARFAERALAAVSGSVTVAGYRGYGISGLPADLDPASAAAKSAALAIYSDYDPDAGLTGVGSVRTQRIYPRYLSPPLRVVSNAAGPPCFLAVVSGSVRVWGGGPVTLAGAGGGGSTGNAGAPGLVTGLTDASSLAGTGSLTGTGGTGGTAGVAATNGALDPGEAQTIGGPPVEQPLAGVRQANGVLRVFALRTADFHLITATQTSSGLFTAWADLGNPNLLSPYEIGSPEAVVDRTGQVYVFVKNYAGSVSMRMLSATTTAATWADWVDLGGTGVIESVSATTSAAGAVELFAPTAAGIRAWAAPSPGAAPVLVPGLFGSPPAGPVTLVPSPDGRLQIFYRAAGDTTVRMMWRAGALTDQRWHGPVELGSAPGSGPIAAVASGGRTTVVASTTTSQLSTSHQSAGSVAFSRSWRTLPGGTGQQPVLATDPLGRLLVAILAPDGTLRVRPATEVATSSPYAERVLA